MLELLAKRWWVVLLRGIAAIGLGVLTIVWPQITLLALILLYGMFCLADGVAAIVLGFSARMNDRIWWEMIALGVLAVLAGLAAVAWPGLTAIVFVYIIALFAVLRGVAEIAAAIQLRKVIDDEWLLALSGGFSILVGILLMAAPGEGALAMVLLIGALMIALGTMSVALALRLRHLSQRLAGLQRPAE